MWFGVDVALVGVSESRAELRENTRSASLTGALRRGPIPPPAAAPDIVPPAPADVALTVDDLM